MFKRCQVLEAYTVSILYPKRTYKEYTSSPRNLLWLVVDVPSPLVYVSGYNEPMRTRVHNNAGSEAVIRESFQINIDVTRLKI